jgi:hypothetical protein
VCQVGYLQESQAENSIQKAVYGTWQGNISATDKNILEFMLGITEVSVPLPERQYKSQYMPHKFCGKISNPVMVGP